ncbi:MAG: PASTA domain-containing protein [Clostridia bacterium]|nr:PASTA domain-containing protein [Clostridia bacterium]
MNENKFNLPKWAIPVIGVLVAGIVVAVLFLTGVIGTRTVEVPDIMNINAEKAQRVLEDAGLSLCITRKEISDKHDENTVLEQSPVSGEKIEKGGTVNVVVSEKPVEVAIPDVVNYQKDLAIKALQTVGLKVETIEEFTDEFANGAVIKQSKTGKAYTGAVIVITVAKNTEKQAERILKIPAVTGETLLRAKEIIQGNFYVIIAAEEYSDTVKKGAIISQTPAANTDAKVNSVINVVISKGKASEAKITMPSVTLATRMQAKTTLENLGLKVVIKEKFSDSVASGVVMAQSIPKGKTVSANTTVTITVSKGKQPAESLTTVKVPTTIPTTKKPETTTKKNPSQNVTTTPPVTKPVTTEPTTLPTTTPDTGEESKYVADFRITTDKATVSAGDIVTVSVKLKTNYKIGAVSLPVIYDARVFEIADAKEGSLNSFLNFSGKLTENGYETNGNWKSPESMYARTSNPDKWLDKTTMANYKIAFATWIATPSQGTVMTQLDSEETIVTFRLKVKENATGTSGQIFLSQDFIKTSGNPQGILSVGRSTSDKVTVDSIVPTGQTLDLKDATTIVVIN